MSFGKFEAVEAEVEICYNKRINNETVSPFCGKTLGAKDRTVACNLHSLEDGQVTSADADR